MENQNTELKKGKTGWMIAGYVFAILGGLLGIFIGINYVSKRYDQATRSSGWAMIVIGVVMFLVWNMVARA
jgi:hypothetical protein